MQNPIATSEINPILRTVLQVTWPGFFAAGILVGLLFSIVDPAALDIVQDRLHNSREAAYTLAFVVIWAVVSSACATTLLLYSGDK